MPPSIYKETYGDLQVKLQELKSGYKAQVKRITDAMEVILAEQEQADPKPQWLSAPWYSDYDTDSKSMIICCKWIEAPKILQKEMRQREFGEPAAGGDLQEEDTGDAVDEDGMVIVSGPA